MRRLFTPKRLAIFFGLLAVAMLVTELVWRPIFTVQLTESIAVPIWILVGIYALLQWILHRAISKRLDLTEAEIAQWGSKLEEITPKILELYEQHTPVRDIAADIHENDGVPPDITLRYIIALARHAKQAEQSSQP